MQKPTKQEGLWLPEHSVHALLFLCSSYSRYVKCSSSLLLPCPSRNQLKLFLNEWRITCQGRYCSKILVAWAVILPWVIATGFMGFIQCSIRYATDNSSTIWCTGCLLCNLIKRPTQSWSRDPTRAGALKFTWQKDQRDIFAFKVHRPPNEVCAFFHGDKCNKVQQ